MAQPQNNYVYNSDSEPPVTTDEEKEEILHKVEMKKLEQSMKLVRLHRTQKQIRKRHKDNKARLPSLKIQAQHILHDVFHIKPFKKFITFTKNDHFSFRNYEFPTKIIKPSISITYSNDVYYLKIQTSRTICEYMRWSKRYRATYDTYNQKDSKYYYKDLEQDLIDHIQIMKYDYCKNTFAMLINMINTPIGPIVYWKYEKDIKDKQLNKIIIDLKEKMIRKVQMRYSGIILPSSESENEDCP
eukprot:257534_1